jgi:tetratricopeptide (TPR) repeat protein
LIYWKKRNADEILFRLSLIIIPIIAALFISQVELSAVKNLQDKKGDSTDYGTVTERVASFTIESNQIRLQLWEHAIDYSAKHLLMGCGYGNWKIASIPYQRIITKDLYVPVHAHNDFLENFAELGIPGGLLYLSLFVCILFFTVKTFLSKASEEIKLISVISFLAFIGYSVDAFFNFPMERPISQIFFVFITVWNITAYVSGRQSLPEESTGNVPVNNTIKPLFGLVSLLLLIPAVYVTYETYRSLVLQKTVLADLNNEPLKLNWKETIAAFPSIPNLTATAQPVDAIKGRYLYEAGQYEEAIALLDKGRIANPTIAYSEFLKAGLYFKTNRLDSAVRNATYAFSVRPRAKTYYQTLIAVLAKVKDTSGIKKAFAEYDRYRHEPLAWDLYLRGMLNAQGKGTKQLLLMADSALKMFANQEGVAAIATVRDEIIRFMENPNASNSNAGNMDIVTAAKFYNDAVAAFGSGVAGKDNLEKAASLFLKSAALNPGNYVAYENAAICYFNLKQWQKSITYFNKVLATKLSTNGKPEYFKGVALYNLNQREEGCNYLRTSLAKGWKEAEAIIKANCK